MNATELIERFDPCVEGAQWAESKTITEAWESCERSDWMLWLLDKLQLLDGPVARLMAVRFARRIEHLMTDQRSIAAIEVAERHTAGLATDEELAEAEAAAMDAARAASWAASWAAFRAASWAAAMDAARAASWAAERAAARAAERAAARAAERKAQCVIIREFFPSTQIERIAKNIEWEGLR